jgi:hypothetical protein
MHCSLNVRIITCIFLILIIKINEINYFSNLFWYRTLHVSDRFTVHHQEPSTSYIAIGICHTEILKMGRISSVYTYTL